jgi:hypothetical protein
MDLTTPIDAYCERLGPGLLAEPLNAATNLAFIVAGLWLLRNRAAGPERLLAALIVLVGLGSAAFHLWAQPWAGALDVGFIALFIVCYVVCWLRRVYALPWRLALLGLPGWFAWSALVTAPFPRGAWNGSLAYLPALLGLLLMALVLRQRRLPGGHWLAAGAACFALSLGLRSMDLAWCGAFPAGTHWLWHLLNATTLALCVRGLPPQWRPAGR